MYKHLKRNKGGLARMAGGGQPSKVLSGNIMAGASWNSINPTLANELTQATGKPTYNAAVGATTSADTYKQLMDFIEAGGSFEEGANVFLQAGGADFLKGVSRKDTEENLDRILTELEKRGVNVVLTGSPDASSYEQVISNNFNPASDQIYNNVVAKHSNVVLVDSMGEILQDKSLLSDSIHPNEQGWEVYNNSVLGALNQLKKREEPQDQVKTQETIKDTAVDIPQEIERITSKPEEQYTPSAEAEEPVNITEEIDRITNKPEVTQPETVEQTYTPPSTVQETPSIPYETQETASIPERQPEAVETRSGPDYSRAYGALGGEEVVNNLYKQFLGMGLDEDTIGSVFSKYYSPDAQEAKKGGAIRMQVGGLSALANAGKAGAKVSKTQQATLLARGMEVPGVHFADTLNPNDIMRMSEALGASGSEGKTLNLTQADRSRVFGPNKGGTGFSGLQLTSPPHQQARSTWGVGKPSHLTRLTKASDDDTIWSTFIGSPTQHMSNPVTTQRMYEAHKKANPSAKLVEDMNTMLNKAVDEKTGKPMFPNGIDISDPSSLNQAQTFNQRKLLAKAMVMGGEKKGEKATQEAFRIIKEETDPLLMDSPTYAVGNRLFTIDKNSGLYRPDLNSAFPYITTGDDLGLLFEPAPLKLAAPQFVNQEKYLNRLDKNNRPSPISHKDLSSTTPKQFVSEEYLTNLQKEGYKDGGSAEPPPFHDFDQIMKRKDGGTVNQSFEQRLKSALDQHMAGGGEVHMEQGGSYPPKKDVPAMTPQQYLDLLALQPKLGLQSEKQIKAKLEEQYRKEKEEGFGTPQARIDRAIKTATPFIGAGADIGNFAANIPHYLTEGASAVGNYAMSKMPSMSKPASVLDTEGKGDRVPKYPLQSLPEVEPFYGSSAMQRDLKNAGVMGDSESPVYDTAMSFLAPYGAAKAPRAIEGGLNAVTAAARRPFTPATITTEAVAPDLAKFKPREFQDEVTRQMIGEGAAVPMTNMGGRKTTQRGGQGVYMNDAGQLELNPMVGVDVPRAGNLSTNKSLRRDIATAGQELNQEAMAAHRFVPMATNNIKDATAMMVTGPNGRALSNEEVIALGKNIPGLIVSHSPRTGGVFLANDPYAGGDPMKKFLNAQSVAGQILGNKAKIQFGKADANKDLMYMMRNQYAEEGGRGTSPTAQAIRESLKRKDQTIPTVRN